MISNEGAFEFRGQYRIQSRRTARPSSLRGAWSTDDNRIAGAVNRVLHEHPLRSPGRSVALRTASIVERTGTFAMCPDVLYKRDLFVPDAGTPSLDTNIVDLDKANARWDDVSRTLAAVWHLGDTDILGAVGDPHAAIRLEYFAHEAGHLIGADVDEKAAADYFRPDGRLRWALVYVEEVRADLHALAIAADAYSPAEARAVFHYHVATRFGMHHLRRGADAAPFGLVPYLLFVALRELNLIDVVSVAGADRFILTASCADDVAAGMRACGSWAADRITCPELDGESALDMALASASYMRACVDRADLVAVFTSVLGDGAR